MKRNSKKNLFLILGLVSLIGFVGGITYAFFNYTKTGNNNSVKAGNVEITSNYSGITLSNILPITQEEVERESNNFQEITITVTGKTTSSRGIEYLISIMEIHNTLGIPISLMVSMDNLGNSDTDYFNHRGSSNKIYKLLKNVIIDGEEKIAVGYIPNNNQETNGTISIKVFVDSDNVLIGEGINPDTLEVNQRAYTLEEWSSLSENPISFKIKLEASDGVWVEETLTAYKQIIKKVNTEPIINFAYISSSTNGQGLYILPGTESDEYPIYYYRGAVEDNNVIFGDFCWQMVRTTDTGGIKMIYNGEVTGNGATCENTTYATKVLANASAFNSNRQSLSDIGYMSNTRYQGNNTGWVENALFASGATWVTDHYELSDASVTSPDATHHYSCNATTTGATCTSLRFVYYVSDANYRYITLTNGDLVEDALYKMTGNGDATIKAKHANYVLNQNDSTIKGVIESWFRTNLTNEVDNTKTNYKVYLEDTVFCNDRSYQLNGTGTITNSGWNPNGGSLSTLLAFGAGSRAYNGWYSKVNVPATICPNETDRFSVSSSVAHLNYPVGMLTADEIVMAGASGNTATDNNACYLYTENNYWSISPRNFDGVYSREFHVKSPVVLYGSNVGSSYGVRPVVSLKPEIEFEEGGDGTSTNPYVVKYN